MVILIRLKDNKTMKTVFSLLLMLVFGNLMGQNSSIVIASKKYKSTFTLNNLTIYSAPCEANEGYKLANRFIMSFDSIEHIGYMNSYKYADYFTCQDSISHLIIEQIGKLLAERRGAQYEIGILYGMKDNSQEFIGYLSLFKNKKFKKFLKKANRLAKRAFSGEIMILHEYDYDKYAKEFIIAKTGNGLSLIEVQ